MKKNIESISVDDKKKIIGKEFDFSTGWVAFAYRLQKNVFFRRKKLELQDFTCCVCEKKIDGKFHLHHITYRYYCQFKTYIIGKKGGLIPNCQLCFENTNDFFQNCNERTVIVHNYCHARLHNRIKTKEYLENKTNEKLNVNEVEAINKGSKWTEEETARFIQLARVNTPIETICKKLGRNRGGIIARIKKHGFEEQYLR